MDAIERLTELLDEKDAKINELCEQVETFENDREWKWAKHQMIENDPLPVPRLELRWSNVNEWEKICTYSLVYKHLLGYSVQVPLGETKTSGRMKDFNCVEDWKPFRDGAYFGNEMGQLNLPGFIIIGDEIVHEIRPSNKAINADQTGAEQN